ncbi:MAG: DUF3999 family protein [Acidobacteriaceae bacterium]
MIPVRYAAVLLLLAFAANGSAVRPEMKYFRYERKVENTPQSARQTCVAIEPGVFARAAEGLTDLRLYHGSVETPYALRKAAPAAQADETVTPLNLGRRGGQTVFDAAMPAGEYGDVALDVTGQNFIVTVKVSGSQTQSGGAWTKIGSYTIFDLTREKLGRSTVLHLPRSDFRFLHFDMDGAIAPEQVKGLKVLHVAASHLRYVTVAESSDVEQKGRESVIRFTVPAHMPVDRVVFDVGASPTDFSRDVQIRVQPVMPAKASDSEEPRASLEAYGNLLRIHRVEQGHRLNEERLSVAAPGGVPDAAARWTVTIENGDDTPIALHAVRLEMVERDVCFHAEGGADYTLYYGDAALKAPQYDYATLFVPQSDAATAKLGPEVENPEYEPRPDTRPFSERHPGLLWAALVIVILLLGAIALRSARHAGPAS